MKKYCIENLQDIKFLLLKIDDEAYSLPLEILSNSSIGQHVRHIIELYQAAMVAIPYGTISYDKRKRDGELEQDKAKAIQCIEDLCLQMKKVESDLYMTLLGDFSQEGEEELTSIETTLYRELAYNLEHSIHHQALIKIGCFVLGLEYLLPINFGVAPATVKHWQKNFNNLSKSRSHAR